MMIPHVLSIAGSDPSGGAGIQADLKTFSALGCYGMAVITALTAQNTRGVSAVHEVPHEFLLQQIKEIFIDIRVDSLKIGMVGSVQAIGVLSESIQRYKPQNVVLDPVMVATSGDRLISEEAAHVLRRDLVPLCSIMTPNIPEAEILLGKSLEHDFNFRVKDMAKALLDLGAPSLLLKGGHLGGASSKDIYADQSGVIEILDAARVKTSNTHGTGCTLSSALACYMAKGLPLLEAAHAAKRYVTLALHAADQLSIGRGRGPVQHFHSLWS